MTPEEKQILLQDLCARLPYGVKVYNKPYTYDLDNFEFSSTISETILDIIKEGWKPYLRPLSSMTEEETWATASYDYNKLTYGMDYAITAYVDYLYSIHIDCHNLIPKGLALPAPEGMYKVKE